MLSWFLLKPQPAQTPHYKNVFLDIAPMVVTSPAFEHNAFIPSKYTCDGENISPPLLISDVPRDAKSLAIVVDDPDAPAGTWVHWVVWNIPPAASEIAENSVPKGAVEGITSFGKIGYGGPCPPSGTHRYFFKLYALDSEIGLSSQAGKAQLKKAMEGRIIAEAELVGLYGRK